ncbi:MAG: hypothetical protein ACRDRU_11755 [Pseudonocardiaceae bacterium]
MLGAPGDPPDDHRANLCQVVKEYVDVAILVHRHHGVVFLGNSDAGRQVRSPRLLRLSGGASCDVDGTIE